MKTHRASIRQELQDAGCSVIDELRQGWSDETYGPQYPRDDSFKAVARLHQSRFRVHELGIADYRDYGSRLPSAAALAGKNFYPWPGLLDAVAKRFGRGDKKLYWDMLASDNVPFNFFIPLRDLALIAPLLASWTGDSVKRIREIKIEWAPSPAADYLDDNTSFDVYLEYERDDGRFGAVGVETKYTERSYGWGVQERQRMGDGDSLYHRVHHRAGIYEENATDALATKKLKQFWRNQLLGEAMLQRSASIGRFTSVLLYPSTNTHFSEASAAYCSLLRPAARERFVAVTYEQFIADCRGYDDAPETASWLEYLERRYVLPSAMSESR
jgi:hypothetical protein